MMPSKSARASLQPMSTPISSAKMNQRSVSERFANRANGLLCLFKAIASGVEATYIRHGEVGTKPFVGGNDPCEGPVDDAGYVKIMIHEDMIAFVVRVLQEKRSALERALEIVEMHGLCLLPEKAKYQVRVDRKLDE